MEADTRWNLDPLATRRYESQFSAAQLTSLSPENATFVRPTRIDSARAVANIRAWRGYLPEACVSSMISDGWQWST